MPNRLYRDLVMLRSLLEGSGAWRLTADGWRRAAAAVDLLAEVLAAPDASGLDEVIEQFEAIDPETRMPATSIDDPRRGSGPDRFQARVVELIPRIDEYAARVKQAGGQVNKPVGGRVDGQVGGRDPGRWRPWDRRR